MNALELKNASTVERTRKVVLEFVVLNQVAATIQVAFQSDIIFFSQSRNNIANEDGLRRESTRKCP